MQEVHLLDLYCGAGECSSGYMQAAATLNIPLSITGLDSSHKEGYPYTLVLDSPLSFLAAKGKQFHFIHYNRGLDQDPAIRDYLYNNGFTAVISGHHGNIVRPDLYLSADMFNAVGGFPCLFECVNWFCFRPAPGKILEYRRSHTILPCYTQYIGLQLFNYKTSLL
jgi:hypothetical protein